MQCRICLENEESIFKVVRPCLCAGTSAYVHRECLNSWRAQSNEAFSTCPSCKAAYKYVTDELNPDHVRYWFKRLVLRDTLMVILGLMLVVYLGACAERAGNKSLPQPYPNFASLFVVSLLIAVGCVVILVMILLACIQGGGPVSTSSSSTSPPISPTCAWWTAFFVGVMMAMLTYKEILRLLIENRWKVLNRRAMLKDAFSVADYDDPHAIASIPHLCDPPFGKRWVDGVCVLTIALGSVGVYFFPI